MHFEMIDKDQRTMRINGTLMSIDTMKKVEIFMNACFYVEQVNLNPSEAVIMSCFDGVPPSCSCVEMLFQFRLKQVSRNTEPDHLSSYIRNGLLDKLLALHVYDGLSCALTDKVAQSSFGIDDALVLQPLVCPRTRVGIDLHACSQVSHAGSLVVLVELAAKHVVTHQVGNLKVYCFVVFKLHVSVYTLLIFIH